MPDRFLTRRTGLGAALRHRFVPILLSAGLAGLWLGHGMQAATGKPELIHLFTGSLRTLFEITLSPDTAATWVRAIGRFDIAVSGLFAVLLLGQLRTRGWLHHLARSRTAIAVYAAAAVWAATTAASYMIAAQQVLPQLWEFIERAPAYLIPVALAVFVHQHRRTRQPAGRPRPPFFGWTTPTPNPRTPRSGSSAGTSSSKRNAPCLMCSSTSSAPTYPSPSER
jgi:hypothetical protein